MRYSKLFGKTTKNIERDATMKSHKLLLQAGFIKESTAGRYYYLPLGWRVHQKIHDIIKEEMDLSGAQEMITPTLHPLELWKETNRTSTAGFELMKVKDRSDREFALGGTAEEMFTDLVRKMNLTHKDLPFNIYQFSTKFRDEKRARGGLLRVREFVMKDAYSFDKNEEEFKKTYDQMVKTYSKIYERLGLKTTIVESDNGYIGGEYCHEFVVESDAGESKYYIEDVGNAQDAFRDTEGVEPTRGWHEEVCRFLRDKKNLNEELKPLEEVDAIRGTTMEDGVKLHKKPLWLQIKDVLFVDDKNRFILSIIRGDYDVNEIKLAHLTKSITLRHATEDEIRNILHSEPGFISPVGIKECADCDAQILIVADESLRTIKNAYGGSNKKHRDLFNMNIDRDYQPDIEGDIAQAQNGFLSINNKKLISKKGIEVGNTFQLGYHYTNLMKGANYINENGMEEKFYMGCYGIGLGRTLAAIVEKFNDEKGILWPESIAPFKYHLITLPVQDFVEKKIDELIDSLQEKLGNDLLWDDREGVSAGAKFADADLIGCPIRLVISEKTNGKIELKLRGEKESKLINLEDIFNT
jgi:prolyl-tRNA synthetase